MFRNGLRELLSCVRFVLIGAWKADKAKSGLFTLVELLVVIAIIGILSGLVSTALARAKEKGKSISCVSNLKQIALANHLYSNDYSCFVAGRSGGFSSGQHWHGWRESSSDPWDPSKSLLIDYFDRNATIKECPAWEFDESIDSGTARNLGAGGYGYNFAGVGSTSYLDGYGNGWLKGMEAGSLALPSQTIMFGDCAHLYKGEVVENDDLTTPYSLYGAAPEKLLTKKPTNNTNNSKIHFRHIGFGNIAWADGHVSSESRTYSMADSFFGDDGGECEERAVLNIGNFGPRNNSLYDPWSDDIPEE